jgi:heme O synthase-like polyprenyltransferase|tara:strand:- start:111 stop:356 length:246 start_codon:yes stop_codon:yes gene_type:complete
MKGNLMARSKKYSRRYNDVKINMVPDWIDTVMNVCKYFLYIVPFLCCCIAMLLEGTLTSQSYVLTAVWCLSLLKLIELTEK